MGSGAGYWRLGDGGVEGLGIERLGNGDWKIGIWGLRDWEIKEVRDSEVGRYREPQIQKTTPSREISCMP